jgi:hypothetical protein
MVATLPLADRFGFDKPSARNPRLGRFAPQKSPAQTSVCRLN